MRRILIAPSSLLLVLAFAPAEAQEPLKRVSLDDALRLAARQSPTVRAKEAEVQSSKAAETTAGLRPNPTGSFAAEQFGAGADTQYTVAIGQPIELGGKRQRRIDAAQAATRVTGYQLEDVRRQTVLSVQTAFNSALVARAALALAEENLKTLDETERLQRLRVDKGDLAPLELTRIEVQRFAFERDAADARAALETAKTALRTATGADGLAPAFDVDGTLEFRDVVLEREVLVQQAVASRPDLRAAETDQTRAKADHALARANAWWDITPQIEYQRIGPDNTIGFGISLPLRIFDRNQGEIARTRSEIERVAAVRRTAELQVLNDVNTDFTVYHTQRARVLMLRDTYLPKAQNARDIVEYAYRRGGQSLLDFLDAQRSYRETALAYLQALGAYWGSIYQLEADVGRRLDGRQ
jgi:cobalt-zinc-cadmium efflux system outer membrane protein